MKPSIFSVAVLGGVAAVDYDINPITGPNNEVVNISSCQSITCDKYTSGMCTRGSEPGAASTVGLVANAFEYNWGQGPYTDMSFTLVTGMASPGFTNLGSDRYEWSDAHLFVGLNRSLDTEYYPRGCGLMLQYEEQTFPLEPFPGNVTRYPEYQNTTNCDGVITTHCQTSLAEMILKFKPEPLPEDGFEVPFDEGSNFSKRPDNCTQLADYMNTQLANSNDMCGRENGAWISSSIKVTGGPLPSAKSVNDMLDGALGSNKCYPVLPEDYRLFKVAETRHIYYHNPPTADAAFYGQTNAGLSGWTPIVALWTDDGEGWSVRRATIQFMCMRTFKTDGGEPESPYEKSSGAGALSTTNSVSYGFLVCLAGFWLLFNIASGSY